MQTNLMLAILAVATAALIAGADEARKPVPQSLALKLGPEELTQYTDLSESGQDRAAILYANAKRVETEHALAQKDVTLVGELEGWRQILRRCRRGCVGLAYVVNGGGTMYSHAQARDGASLEDFLAELAKRLPLAEGKGDPEAAKQVDDTIAFLKKLKLVDTGDSKGVKAAKAQLVLEVEEVTQSWSELKYMISELKGDEAESIAAFAVESLGFLKEG
ncbi:MAG TPA: hypothetical protein VGH65_03350 [Verrucomicrobiaceae bacterium]|jgi:hypothetical protein